MIDGVAWHVCDGHRPTTPTGRARRRARTAAQWSGSSAQPKRRPALTSTSGTFDLKAMFQWMETHDVPGEYYPYMEPGSSIEALSEGWEIASTGGVPEHSSGSGSRSMPLALLQCEFAVASNNCCGTPS